MLGESLVMLFVCDIHNIGDWCSKDPEVKGYASRNRELDRRMIERRR
jgi:hypothetical protein